MKNSNPIAFELPIVCLQIFMNHELTLTQILYLFANSSLKIPKLFRNTAQAVANPA